MLEKEEIEEIKNNIEEFFKKMGIEGEVEILSQKENAIFLNFKTKEAQLLIGERGEILLSIQHILRLILRKKINKEFFLDFDIGGYKRKKIEYLKELARAVADEVSLSKKARILEPMLAYERKVIHLELASRPDVITESIGKEPKRRVVIKPYP